MRSTAGPEQAWRKGFDATPENASLDCGLVDSLPANARRLASVTTQRLRERRVASVKAKRSGAWARSAVAMSWGAAVMTGVAGLASTYATAAEPVTPQAAALESQPAKSKKPASDIQVIKMVFVFQEIDDPVPLSLLDFTPKDLGLAGAKLGVNDNNTTGRFLKQSFELTEISGSDPAKLVAEVKALANSGIGLFVVAVDAETLLKMSDALKDEAAVLFNARATDLDLREENCRANVKHTAPSRAMLVDALAQYLFWKRWRKIALVQGPAPEDAKFADAIRRSAKKFNLRIVEEGQFEYQAGSRRTDGGFEQVQKQIPSFTQDYSDYDVLIVADEKSQFGNYFPYRTWIPRPVAGTHGLFPASWHPSSELWGASQFQNRFQRLTNRTMRDLDYQAWMAIRAIGEAATRTSSADPKTLIDYMLSDQFELAAFKGQKLTFRPWNAQLRQPIFVATDKLHVTVSPQAGFLHQKTVLDTLGLDEPETKCTAFKK
ncbi:MAG: ABC transporter substrate-binding protein [Pseudomonadota bacterium]